MKLCDICGEGHVIEVIDENDYFDVNFVRHVVLMKVYECDHCMSEYANAAQVTFNKQQVVNINKLNEKMENI
jgi:hypothetical protein